MSRTNWRVAAITQDRVIPLGYRGAEAPRGRPVIVEVAIRAREGRRWRDGSCHTAEAKRTAPRFRLLAVLLFLLPLPLRAHEAER